MISSTKKFGKRVASKLTIRLKAYDPMKVGNTKEVSNFGGKIGKLPVPPPGIKKRRKM